MTIITCKKIEEEQRANHTGKLFGDLFPLSLEPVIFSITSNLSRDYSGGYWHFYELSNCGFYMAPDDDTKFSVTCENGFKGTLSADALGITACLYAYSNLSFSDSADLADKCAQQYHLLRDFMFEHPEAKAILKAID
jgi:hypothetical protein